MKKTLLIVFILFLFMFCYSNSDVLNYTLKSFALPGWGFVDAGNRSIGGIFISTEIVFAASSIVNYYLKDFYAVNALNYASKEFNVNVSSYPFWILTKMELYENSDYHNEIIYQRARDIYPDDIEKQKEYIERNSIPDAFSWSWTDTERMDEYYGYRKSSRAFNQFMMYSISSLVLNHFASGLATYLYTKNISKEDINMQGYINKNEFNLNLSVRFY